MALFFSSCSSSSSARTISSLEANFSLSCLLVDLSWLIYFSRLGLDISFSTILSLMISLILGSCCWFFLNSNTFSSNSLIVYLSLFWCYWSSWCLCSNLRFLSLSSWIVEFNWSISSYFWVERALSSFSMVWENSCIFLCLSYLMIESQLHWHPL